MKKKKQISVSLVLLVLILLAGVFLVLFRPKIESENKKAAPYFVKVLKVEKRDFPIFIDAWGAVTADKDFSLKPEVGGIIVELSPHLVDGGRIVKDESLLKVERTDYENTLEIKKSEFERAQLDYKIELGRQVIAEREWELINTNLKSSPLANELALRKPHLIQAKAALEAAKSSVKKAEEDLSKTDIVAPFNGIVIKEDVQLGQLIFKDAEIAKFVATDAFRVQISIPLKDLQWIDLSHGPIPAKIDGRLNGEVVRLLADLDPEGRMARLLVLVKNPLEATPPLLIGTYVPVSIQGPVIKGAIEIPLSALHESDKVWLVDQESKLKIQAVKVLMIRQQSCLIESGLNPGDLVVISEIPYAIPGMELKYE